MSEASIVAEGIDPTARLDELIRDCLAAQYTSHSCHEGLPTGNHYQSVALGEDRTRGFRDPRGEFFDVIDFEGRSVLDLGSNLGEMSRIARTHGARLVDGFEYDEHFVRLANLINARNGVTRVSFYQRDITDPSIYREPYDIVLAFSVFTYLAGVLDELAAITDRLLVLETHRLEDNLERTYLEPLGRHFPHHRILGESDWGTSLEGGRAIIAFARDEADLPPVPGGAR